MNCRSEIRITQSGKQILFSIFFVFILGHSAAIMAEENLLVDENAQNAEIKQEVERLIIDQHKYDLVSTLSYIETLGYSCVKTVARVDFDFFCDFKKPVKVTIHSEDVWIMFRRGILLAKKNNDLKVEVSSSVTAP